MTQFFQNNVWVNIVSIVIGVLGIYLAFLFYFKSKNQKVPICNKSTSVLIDTDLKKLVPIKLIWEGEEFEELTMTKIAFWNGGNATITGDDIAKIDPLRITVKEGVRVLSIQVVYQSKLANNVKVALGKENNTFCVTFEYLDWHEGFVVAVFRTGRDRDDVNMKGSVRGVNKLIDASKEPRLIIAPLELIERLDKFIIDNLNDSFVWRFYKNVKDSRNILVQIFVGIPLGIIWLIVKTVIRMAVIVFVLPTVIIGLFSLRKYIIPEKLEKEFLIYDYVKRKKETSKPSIFN